MTKKLHCPYCKREPHEIDEYVERSQMEDLTAEKLVRIDEGTYSRAHNLFTCTSCYIKTGMPLNANLFYDYTKYREMFPE